MPLPRYRSPLLAAGLVAAVCLTATAAPKVALENLGRALYFDANLSHNRSQSCATCHAPQAAFSDPRDNPVSRAVSVGADGHTLGRRNAPSTAYARFIPPFRPRPDGGYSGGLFWDGRADNLAEQAGGPLLNAKEMAMPNAALVRRRLAENPAYVDAFKALFGPDTLADDGRTVAALGAAIAAFERSPEFSTFDSKYDRYLRGEYRMTAQEELGRVLFFSQQFTNCNQCHQLRRRPGQEQEIFSNFEYHNIGTPPNPVLAGSADLPDLGLAENPAVAVADLSAQRGKFRVPTLRNVALTGPYMHNGVFRELRTVVKFYNKYNSRSPASQINPETGQPWAEPEVAENLSLEKLTHGPALKSRRVDALVAFLKTLTDRRYEPLLENAGLSISVPRQPRPANGRARNRAR